MSSTTLSTGPARPAAAATIASQLTLDEIHRSFGGPSALQGVSLEVRPGEILSLLGPSGCGKTTLLRIAAGVDLPDSGSVLIDSKVVVSSSVFVPPEKRGIGMMFQDYALFPHMTILENVMFGLTALSGPAARDEALAALARVGLARLARAYPHELSGGEQQRAALARAIVPRPGILLMDEPFSGLDVRLRNRIRDETLAILRDSGSTAVIVTHDPREAMMMSDRIVLMNAGRLAQTGSAEDLYLAPQTLYAARFFGPLNEFQTHCRGGRAATPLGEFPAPDFDDGESVIVAIRPQNFALESTRDTSQGIMGRIMSKHFLGEMIHYEVAVAGFDSYLKVSKISGAGLAPGEEVQLFVQPGAAMVFSLRPSTY